MSIPDLNKVESWILRSFLMLALYAKDYISICWKVITKPSQALPKLITFQYDYQMPTFLFFLLNITVTYIISTSDFTAFKVFQEAFEKSKPTWGEFLSFLFSYILGIIIFIVIYQYKNERYTDLKSISGIVLTKAVFYSSAIFIPIVLVERIVFMIVYQIAFYNLFIDIDGLPIRGNIPAGVLNLSATPMRLASDEIGTLWGMNFLFLCLIPLILYVIWLAWWSYLIYCGTNGRSFSKKPFVRNISFALVIFVFLQFATSISIEPKNSWQVLLVSSLKQGIADETNSANPRYGNIAIKTWLISTMDSIPKVLKYEALIGSVVFSLGAYNDKQPIFINTYSYIKDNQFDLAYIKLSSAIESTLSKKSPNDPEYPTLTFFNDLLKDAKIYRDSPDYNPDNRNITMGIKTLDFKERRVIFRLLP